VTLQSRPGESLLGHLERVAKGSAARLKHCRLANAGRVAGLLHDLGKSSTQWQSYLAAGGRDSGLSSPGHIDQGVQWIANAQPNAAGFAVALAIAGHHAPGIPNTVGSDGLMSLLAKTVNDPDAMVVDWIKNHLPREMNLPGRPDPNDIAMAIRMINSALVDADWSDAGGYEPTQKTEAHSWQALCSILDSHVAGLRNNASMDVQTARDTLYSSAKHGLSGAGCYTIKAPTGSGKTLAGLRLAAQACVTHGFRRIIFAIPFTSIVDQTSVIYRPLVHSAGLKLLEHHSAAERIDRISENWDADVIVTTNVQLLESMYSNWPSRLRKLHNIAGSVIVLDEAQVIPMGHLKPCTAALEIFARVYGCAIVLTTATPPAIDKTPSRSWGIQIEDLTPKSGMDIKLRVQEEIWPGITPDQKVLQEMLLTSQSMTIVNTRAVARRLWDQLPGSFHLSTWMCPAHRKTVLSEVMRRLKFGEPVYLISTQVVEAGIDLDFPAVFRAWSGLGSIKQAAGRCNRAGLLQAGRLVVFDPVGQPGTGELANLIGTAKEIWNIGKYDCCISTEAVEDFYALLTARAGNSGLDKKGVLKMASTTATNAFKLSIAFADIAKGMQLIDDQDISVLVPYEGGKEWIERLKNDYQIKGRDMREITPYMASVGHKLYGDMVLNGTVSGTELPFLSGDAYDEGGMIVNSVLNSESLII